MKHLVRQADHRFRRHVLKLWKSRGGGFYGFVAVLTFLYLEAIDLAGDVAGVGRAALLDLGWWIGFLVENLIDVVLNTVWAAMWPVTWIQHFGIGLLSGALLAGAYGVYRLIRPGVLRLLEEPDRALQRSAAAKG